MIFHLQGPFTAFILSVLKPFDKNFSPDSKRSYFIENIQKIQSKFYNIDMLLNIHLTCLPFKSFFENFYKFNVLNEMIETVIHDFDEMCQVELKDHLKRIIICNFFFVVADV